MSLLKIGGEIYIIDFDVMTELISDKTEDNRPYMGEETETKYTYEKAETPDECVVGKEVTVRKYDKGRELDISKYETFRLLLDIVMNPTDETDDTLGIERMMSKMPISFKIAFNTLKYYHVLKRIDI